MWMDHCFWASMLYLDLTQLELLEYQVSSFVLWKMGTLVCAQLKRQSVLSRCEARLCINLFYRSGSNCRSFAHFASSKQCLCQGWHSPLIEACSFTHAVRKLDIQRNLGLENSIQLLEGTRFCLPDICKRYWYALLQNQAQPNTITNVVSYSGCNSYDEIGSCCLALGATSDPWFTASLITAMPM
jgi:hypothetical protein